MSENLSLNKPKIRQSNLELLRIIAMVMIVAYHFSIHGRYTFSTTEITVNRLWIQLLRIGGKIGVNIFVLISGYFLVENRKLKISRVSKIWLQLFTYSIVIFLIVVLCSVAKISLKGIIRHLLPVTFSCWWFASVYFVLYLFHPFLNKLLLSLDKKAYQRFLALALFCWSVIPTITSTRFESNNLVWFMLVYAVAGYIKLHVDVSKFKNLKFIVGTIIFIFVSSLSILVFDVIGKKIPNVGRHAYYLFGMQMLPGFIISVLIFVIFININIKYSKIINTIASATFGVYLIHDEHYIRSILWVNIFKNGSFTNSKFLIPYSFLVIAVVFAVCSAIELLRINFIEKRYTKLIDRFSAFAEEKIDKFFNLKVFNNQS